MVEANGLFASISIILFVLMNRLRYIITLFAGFLGLTNQALAQGNTFNFYDVYYDLVLSGQGFGSGNRVIDLLQGIAGFMIVIGMVLAGIAIIWSGLTYMTAGSNSARVQTAKSIFKNGIIGAVIIFAIGVIVNTIMALVSNPEGFLGF